MENTTTAALHGRAEELETQGDLHGALRTVAEILRHSPTDTRAFRESARLLGRLGHIDAGVAALGRLAEAYARAGYALSAMACAREALALRPGDPSVVAWLGGLHGTIHGRPPTARVRAQPPPTPPVMVPHGDADSLLAITDPRTLVEKAHALLAAPPALAPADPGHVPLFSDLSKDAFTGLVVTMSGRNVPAGSVIVREGDAGSSLFLLVRGAVEVVRRHGEREVVLARLGAGSLFGEMALITSQPRAATVRATEACELFEIDQPHVEHVAGTHRAITDELVQFARRRMLMNLMATSPIFKPFSPERRQEILRAFTSRFAQPGEKIIKEDEEPIGLFLVASGEVRISKRDEGGDRVILAHLREGEVFGEIALIEASKTTASAEAAVQSVLMVLDRAKFRAVADSNPEIVAYLKTLSGDRLRDLRAALASSTEVLEADELVMI